MRIPNQHIKKSRSIRAAIIEYFIYHLRECRVFNKMDLKAGYHQLPIDEKTWKSTIFRTHWGNYRSKWLIFGAKSSQDLFDWVMFQIFGDIPLCMNQRDNIILRRKDREVHNRTIEKVLQRAKEFTASNSTKRKEDLEKPKLCFLVTYLCRKG